MFNSILQPDTLLPAQYLETVRSKTYPEPEKKLLFAVLEDAVTCFQKHFVARDKIGMRLFGEAEEWILLQGKGDWLFSFDNICETLDLNPGTSVRDCCTGGTIGLENGTGFDLE